MDGWICLRYVRLFFWSTLSIEIFKHGFIHRCHYILLRPTLLPCCDTSIYQFPNYNFPTRYTKYLINKPLSFSFVSLFPPFLLLTSFVFYIFWVDVVEQEREGEEEGMGQEGGERGETDRAREKERGWICWFTKDSYMTSLHSHTPTHFLPLLNSLHAIAPHPLLAWWYSSRNRKEPQVYK